MHRTSWIALLALTVPSVAQARSQHHHARPAAVKTIVPDSCEAAIDAAQQSASLPRGLLRAVALVESGRANPRSGAVAPWPWTINVAGQGFFFPSKDRAISAVEALQKAGIASIDVGCMQVNLMYHPTAFPTLSAAFDPDANARYAAGFLHRLYAKEADWTKAVGDYHSQNPTRAAPYELRVLAHWRGSSGALPRLQLYGNLRGFEGWTDLYRVPKSWQEVYFGMSNDKPN